MKRIVYLLLLLLVISCSKNEKEAKILFDDASLLLKKTSSKDTICSEAVFKLKTIIIEYPNTKLAKNLESNKKSVLVSDYGFLTFEEIIHLESNLKNEKEAKILFDDASLLLKKTSNKDTICSEAIFKLKTIIIEYSKTKLTKSLELNVKKVFVANYGLLTFDELIQLEKKLKSMIESNKNEIIANLNNLGANSIAYYKTPKSYGGGAKSFIGISNDWLNLSNIRSSNFILNNIKTTYSIIKAGTKDSVVIQGDSKYWTIQMTINKPSSADIMELSSIKRK